MTGEMVLDTSCKAWPHSGTTWGFSPGRRKLKLRGSRQTGQSFSSSSVSWLFETTGMGGVMAAAKGWSWECRNEVGERRMCMMPFPDLLAACANTGPDDERNPDGTPFEVRLSSPYHPFSAPTRSDRNRCRDPHQYLHRSPLLSHIHRSTRRIKRNFLGFASRKSLLGLTQRPKHLSIYSAPGRPFLLSPSIAAPCRG